MEVLTRIRYDFLTLKNAWDLYCIQNESFELNTKFFKIMDMLKDAIQVMEQKNKRRQNNIVLQFEGESFKSAT